MNLINEVNKKCINSSLIIICRTIEDLYDLMGKLKYLGLKWKGNVNIDKDMMDDLIEEQGWFFDNEEVYIPVIHFNMNLDMTYSDLDYLNSCFEREEIYNPYDKCTLLEWNIRYEVSR